MVGSVCATAILLMCAAGGQALDLLRATTVSWSEYHFVVCGAEVSACFQHA